MSEVSPPEWLQLVPNDERTALLRLLATAPRSREEEARRMLLAPPPPSDSEDAAARVASVIAYLVEAGGYRVGRR